MRFQVISDLHLEVGQQYSHFHIPPSAPYLILAGDIGRLFDYELLSNFLEVQCNNFKQVFLVLGNHEFYGSSRQRGLELAAQLEQEARFQKRLVIMNRKRIDLSDSVILLGCTLWSHITPVNEQIVKSRIQDFRRIADWTPADHNDEHQQDVAWLESEIKQIRASEQKHERRKILVITHHAPIRKGSSAPEHEQNPWTDAFATELIGPLEGQDPNPLRSVDWWIFGHTHFTTATQRAQLRILSNQRGYVLPNQADTDALATESGKKSMSHRQTRALIDKALKWTLFGKNSRGERLENTASSLEQGVERSGFFDVQKCIEV